MIGIIIQARLGSTRLPRKVLLPLPTGETVLERVVKAALETKLPVVVTSPDLIVLDIAEHLGAQISWWQGERNVSAEFRQAANQYDIDPIVRLTADCPLLTPERIMNAVRAYSGQYVYAGPDGVDVEVFRRHELTSTNDEHVTTHLVNQYKSLDTKEDYEKICQILTEQPN